MTLDEAIKHCEEVAEHMEHFCGSANSAVEHRQLAEWLKQVPRWISVDDRLPDDYKDVLVWFEYFRYGDYNCLFQRYGIGNYFDKMWYINGETGWKQLRVIAWQKLPEPPKENNNE